MKKEFSIQVSNDTTLKGYIYEPTIESKAIVQICHGMAEHIERYDDFMSFLCGNGYTVIGYDQRGHGKTAGSIENCGYMDDNNNIEVLVNDIYTVLSYMKENYPNQKIFLFAHSMGSFVSQRFVELYNNEIDGLILSGSSFNGNSFIKLGNILASFITKIKGRRHISKFINNMSLGSYNKHFKPNQTSVDWLSRDNDSNLKYEQDEYCGITFSVSYFKDLTSTFLLIAKDIELIDNDLPIYIMSGDNDPVGNYGKGTTLLFNKLKEIGVQDLTLKLYKDGRHEMLNEINKEEVYNNILEWLNIH